MSNDPTVDTSAGGSNSAIDASGGGSTGAAETAPTFKEIGENDLVKLPGQEKPVKYGEYARGFQSQFTRASQKAAQLEKELTDLKRQASQASNQGQRPVPPSKRQQMIDQIRAKTYLSGEEAAAAVDGVLGEVDSNLSTRDEAIKLIAQKILQQDEIIKNLNGQNTQQSFQGKIKSALSANGLGDDLSDFAQIVYLSHEGEDLDREFPSLLKQHWEKFAQIVRKQDQAKINSARTGRFPGRGGQGSASKPLDTSRMSAKEQADALWPFVNGADNT
jgi:hypothetical protein